MLEADALALVPAGGGELAAGERVELELLGSPSALAWWPCAGATLDDSSGVTAARTPA